jgi:hypothetical protein
MPQRAFALLTAEARPPDAEVLVAQPGRGMFATIWALKRALPEPGWLAVERRWRWIFPAALWLYFAVRALLAVAAGVGGPGDDVGYAVLAAVTGSTALFWRWRWRRARVRRPS